MIYRAIIKVLFENGLEWWVILLIVVGVFAASIVIPILIWLAHQFVSGVVDALLSKRSDAARTWVKIGIWVVICYPFLLTPVPVLAIPGLWIAGRRSLNESEADHHRSANWDDQRQALHDKIVGTEVVYAANGLPESMTKQLCPTCRRGSLREEKDQHGVHIACNQCGYVLNTVEEEQFRVSEPLGEEPR